MAKYFGTNGIRGLYDFLTPHFALKAAFAFSQWTKEKISSRAKKVRIGIGRDMRITSPSLHSACIAGILASGSDAINMGLVSSPTAELMIKRLNLSGLIIVTASHNPAEWNALKFVDWNGVAISKERGAEIEYLIDKYNTIPATPQSGKMFDYKAATEQHISLALKKINTKSIQKRTPHIIVDCGNGTAALIAPRLFTLLGCQVHTINGKIDGTFPGRQSEPTQENIRGLLLEVKEKKADIGIAYDGDADRVIFVDEKGIFVSGDMSFALSARLALEQSSSKSSKVVVTTVATTNAVRDICVQYGAKLHYTKVGAPYLSEETYKTAAISAGEEVGGIIWPSFSLAKDGIFAAAKIIEAICEKETTLSALLKQIPIYYSSKTKVPCKPGINKTKVIEEIATYFQLQHFTPNTLDGVRIDYKDSWSIIRASGTENYFRVFAEAKSQKEADELMERHKKLLQELINK
ncbi:MAG: phosphoglucosamine mutase [Candidatus Anstonellales archaeon]